MANPAQDAAYLDHFCAGLPAVARLDIAPLQTRQVR